MTTPTRNPGETVFRTVTTNILTWLIVGILMAAITVWVGLHDLKNSVALGAQNIKDLTSEVRSLKEKFSKNDLTNQDQNRSIEENTAAIAELKSRVSTLENKPLRLR